MCKRLSFFILLTLSLFCQAAEHAAVKESLTVLRPDKQPTRESVMNDSKTLFLKQAPEYIYLCFKVADKTVKNVYLTKKEASHAVSITRGWQLHCSMYGEKHPINCPYSLLYELKEDGTTKSAANYDGCGWCLSKWLKWLDGDKQRLNVTFLTMPLDNMIGVIAAFDGLEIPGLFQIALEKLVERVKEPLASCSPDEVEQIRAEFWQLEFWSLSGLPYSLKKIIRNAFFPAEERKQARFSLYTDLPVVSGRTLTQAHRAAFNLLITCSVAESTSTIELWDASTLGKISAFETSQKYTRIIPSMAPFIIALSSRQIALINMQSRQEYKILTAAQCNQPENVFWGIVYKSNSSSVIAGLGSDIVIWEPMCEEKPSVLQGANISGGEGQHLLLTPNGKHLVEIRRNGEIFLWDMTAKERVGYNKSTEEIIDSAYFELNEFLVTISKKGVLKWNLANIESEPVELNANDGKMPSDNRTGYSRACCSDPNQKCAMVARSTNGQYVSVLRGNTIQIWKSNTLEATLIDSDVKDLFFTTSSDSLVTIHDNGLRLWHFSDELIENFLSDAINSIGLKDALRFVLPKKEGKSFDVLSALWKGLGKLHSADVSPHLKYVERLQIKQNQKDLQ